MSQLHFDPATYLAMMREDVPPDTLGDILIWLEEAGFVASVEWAWKDLATVRADVPS